MSDVVKEKKDKKAKKTFTMGIFNAEIRIDGQVIEALTVESKDTLSAFQKILKFYPLYRSKYLDDKIGWQDASLLVESLVDESYSVEYDVEAEPLVLGKHEVEIPISGEDSTSRTLTGTFYERMII